MSEADAPLDVLLTVCDREPIHVPEAIQPHGALLVVDPAAGHIVAQAGAVGALAGAAIESSADVERVLGLPLQELKNRLPSSGPGLIGTVNVPDGQVHVVGHRSGGLIVLELERATSQLTAASALGTAQALAARLDSAQNVAEACQHAADAVHKLTGYGRIMVYEFLPDDSGAVVAEARNPDLATLLHHRFPESDIPKQARALYARNHVRVIPDSSYIAAPLEWAPGADLAGGPLDMSDCNLRSVSPVHLQYLRNMGVEASASISIMVGGRLWGLIACHHSEARHLDFVERELAKHIGQLVGAQITSRLRAAGQVEHSRLDQAREEMLQFIRPSIGSVEETLLRHVSALSRAVSADGVAVAYGERIASHGSAPSQDQLRQLLPRIDAFRDGEVFAAHDLGVRFPEASEFAAEASGALSVAIRTKPALTVTWFRAEQPEIIDWAGNPHKQPDPDTGILTPRKSFEAWRENVHGLARPWSSAEINAAARIGVALGELIDQQELRQLNSRLNRAAVDNEQLLLQKDLLMREVHHRVQNSLQLVNSMLYLQEREANDATVSTHFELARQRLTAVAMVHRRLWRTDKLGDVRLDSFLAELVDELGSVWDRRWRQGITLDVAPITLSTDRSVLLGLIVTELLTNAVKYAYNGDPGPILIEASEGAHGLIRLAIGDRGRGIEESGKHQSFGSRLVQTLVSQLSGTLEHRDNHPGLRVELTVPPE